MELVSVAARRIRLTTLCYRRMRLPHMTFLMRVRGDGKCRLIAGQSPSLRVCALCQLSAWRSEDYRVTAFAILRWRLLRSYLRLLPQCCWFGISITKNDFCGWSLRRKINHGWFGAR